VDGFGLYQTDKSIWLRNFPTGIPFVKKPKQVLFGEECKAIVGGSDHGVVYVFDRRTGSELDILPHAKGGMVQTISVSLFYSTSRRTD
jgi:glucose dehydrogenase